jgi:hypothetical protein
VESLKFGGNEKVRGEAGLRYARAMQQGRVEKLGKFAGDKANRGR